MGPRKIQGPMEGGGRAKEGPTQEDGETSPRSQKREAQSVKAQEGRLGPFLQEDIKRGVMPLEQQHLNIEFSKNFGS